MNKSINKSYRLFVFDWEGTLGEDEIGQVLHAICQESGRLGWGNIDFFKARNYVSLGIAHAIEKIFPDKTIQQHEFLLNLVHSSLADGRFKACLIPGALDFLIKLFNAGFIIGIATNKGQSSLQRVMNLSGLFSYVHFYRCQGQVPAKPCPQMLTELMSLADVTASETVMIGDSVIDIEMASAVNVDALGVDFYHLNDRLLKKSGAIAVVDDYQKMATYFGV